jgi:class 3 adenylate cyclase
VIGYFPYKQDASDIVLCGEAIVYVVKDAINPLLLQMGHEGIEVKISADYGQHTIVRYGSDREKSYVDIISATMNLAAKMQSVARGGQMVIGKALYQMLSDDMQGRFEKIRLNKVRWEYRISTERKPYQLFLIAF